MGVLVLAGLFAATCFGGIGVAVVMHGHMNLAAYVPCFLCGVLCFALKGRIRAVIAARWWPWFLLIGILAYSLTNVEKPVYWIGWIYCLVLALAIGVFEDSSSPLLNAGARKIATYSYGLYLLHVPTLYLVFDVWQIRSGLIGVSAYFALSLGFAIVAYHALEKPFVAVGRRLSDQTASFGHWQEVLASTKPSLLRHSVRRSHT